MLNLGALTWWWFWEEGQRKCMMAMYDNKTFMPFFLVAFNFKLNPNVLALLKLQSMIQKTIFLGNWHQVKMFAKVGNSRMNCPCFITFMWSLKNASCPSFGGTCKKPSFQMYHLLHANSWYHRFTNQNKTHL